MYGVCLQKQHLDPTRYPRKLRVNNADMPFLYSLIGTWGPFLFPLTWLAFSEWWDRVESDNPEVRPFVPGTVMNEFYRGNNKIWSPWMARFAYESGLKCVYSNLPGDLSLANNFREAGENYAVTRGAASQTLRLNHLDDDNVRKALSYFPSIEYLSMWQYDFGLRRAGSVGSDRLCSGYTCVDTLTSEEDSAEHIQNLTGDSSSDHSSLLFDALDSFRILPLEHWLLISEMLLGYLEPGAVVAHLQPSLPLAHLLRPCTNVVLSSLGGAEAAALVVPLEYEHLQRDLRSARRLARVLCVLGPCNSAPTSLSMGANMTYFLTEDLCREGGADVGAVIYSRYLVTHDSYARCML
jgi:hypothetical protein